MTLLANKYQVKELIYENPKMLVYRGTQISDLQGVIIKLIKSSYSSVSELSSLQNQYNMMKSIDSRGILKMISFESYNHDFVMILEDFGQGTLKSYFTNLNPSHLTSETIDGFLTIFFPIAIQLAGILQELSSHGIIHKDIKPDNIQFDAKTQLIKINNFSHAIKLTEENREQISIVRSFEGTLAYASPEQTGRIDRGIDYRSDYYSLGVTFYQLLTGRLPFEVDDPIELIHCHLTKLPALVHTVNRLIPPILSEIVAKLMAKNVEDRYQSALGLKRDLEYCWVKWQSTGQIDRFELGKKSLSDRLTIPKKLYGREVTVQAILTSFMRIASPLKNSSEVESLLPVEHMSGELVLLSGFFGVGKTAIIDAAYKLLCRQKGYLIKEEFIDESEFKLPLGTFVKVVRSLIGQLLREDEQQLARYQDYILEIVGDLGQILIDRIPELQQIIGKQSPVESLSDPEDRQRFKLLFHQFIEFFNILEQPIAIFLDNVQWIDEDSLDFLELLMQQSQLLMICTYRDNELSGIHPMMMTVSQLRQRGIIVSNIILSSLNIEHINELVADSFNCEVDSIRPLAEVVYQKTNGNPFFVTKFLKSLESDGLVKFNAQIESWQCDLSQIKIQSLTNDEIDLMANQLQQLPESTQELLQLAACLGMQFDIRTLAMISPLSEAELAKILWTSLQAGAIIPLEETCNFPQLVTDAEQITQANATAVVIYYQFSHDRVRLAAYSLIPESVRAVLNYRIAELLLEQAIAATDGNAPVVNISQQWLSEPDCQAIATISAARLLPIVDLFNCGVEFADQSNNRQPIVQLNYIASHQAKSSHSYPVALQYALHGIELLGHPAWQGESEVADLMFALHELAIELAALCGDLDLIEHLIDQTIANTNTPLKLVSVFTIHIKSLISQNRPIIAISLARLLLEHLGIQLPTAPTRQDVEVAMQEIDDMNRQVESLADLPSMTDPQQLAIMQVAASVLGACYVTDRHLCALVVAIQVNLSIRYGNSPISAYSYATYGIVINNYRRDPLYADRFSQLASILISQPNAENIRVETSAAIGLFLHHRNAHLRETLSIFESGYRTGLATGKLEPVGYHIEGFCATAFWCGENLYKLEPQIRVYHQQLLDLKQVSSAYYCAIHWETILALLDNPEEIELAFAAPIAMAKALPTERLFSPERQGVPQEELISASQDREQIFLFYFYRAMLRFFVGDIADANTDVVRAGAHLNRVVGSICEVGFYFYDSLIALASIDDSQSDLKLDLARIHANQQQLADWAKYAPMNHLHKWQLVEAEIYRSLGDKAAAIEFYNLAIAGAVANEYIQEAALANELAAKFYLSWGKDKIAIDYLQTAYDGYTQWGATAKIKDLTDRYPHLLKAILPEQISRQYPLLAEDESDESIDRSITVENTLMPSHLSMTGSSSTPYCSIVDLNAHIRAIQALYNEIDLDRLLKTLMNIVVENAGADKAALLLNQDGQLTIAIEYDDGELDTLDFDLYSFDQDYRLPLSLIRHVHRSQETEILNGDNNPYLASEPYFEGRQPQSILCVPILNQSQLIGILYLENSLMSGTFTHDRVELLNIICTQAAICLENARLHQEAQAYSKRLEQSLLDLQFSEARLHKIADNIPGAIAQLCINPDQNSATLRYVSSGCYELYELTATEMIEGKYSLRHFEHPEDRLLVDQSIQASSQNNTPIKLEYRIITPSGKVKWIHLAASNLESQSDGSLLAECTILDISDRKQAEIELQTTNEELLRSNQLKDQFLANMSHELRTPLNAILGMTEGLQEQVFGAINPEQLVALNTVEKSSTHLLELINDILELAKIEAGQLEIDLAPAEIEALCQSSLIFIKQQAFQKQIQVDIKIPLNLPYLFVDERRMRQVLINLLNNAVKFTPKGGQIDLSVAYLDTQKRIKISITDTGIGISPDNMKKLFKPFIQIDGALNRQFEGTGLGLALVKRIVDLHHGELELTSELGLGSCFTVILPCETIPIEFVVTPSESSVQITPSFDNQTTNISQRVLNQLPLILLVEDNDANIHTMSSYLNAKGYQIVVARNGQEAIKQTTVICPDLILMDIQMPIVDGLTATRQIREFSDIPIIALTALASTEDRENCLKAGANEYLSKPVKLKQLTTVIDRCLINRN